jgi:hypothetical protein
MNLPSINWFGGMMVTRSLLEWSKAGIDDESPESFVAKMNRSNFIQRALYVTQVLHAMGPTLQAAQAIQAGGRGFFNNVSAEALATKLEESVAALRKGGVYKFRVAELGSLDFHGANVSESKPDAAD